jgi:hypothetical protein
VIHAVPARAAPEIAVGDSSQVVQKSAACDDPVGIEYANRKFMAYAGVVAKGRRQLRGQAEGGAL